MGWHQFIAEYILHLMHISTRVGWPQKAVTLSFMHVSSSRKGDNDKLFPMERKRNFLMEDLRILIVDYMSLINLWIVAKILIGDVSFLSDVSASS